MRKLPRHGSRMTSASANVPQSVRLIFQPEGRITGSILIMQCGNRRRIECIGLRQCFGPGRYGRGPCFAKNGSAQTLELASLRPLFVKIAPFGHAQKRFRRPSDFVHGIVSGRRNDPVCGRQIFGEIVDPAKLHQVSEIGFVSFTVDRSPALMMSENRDGSAIDNFWKLGAELANWQHVI